MIGRPNMDRFQGAELEPGRDDYTDVERQFLCETLRQVSADIEYAAEDWRRAIHNSDIPPDLRPTCDVPPKPEALPSGWTLNDAYSQAMLLVYRVDLMARKVKEGKL